MGLWFKYAYLLNVIWQEKYKANQIKKKKKETKQKNYQSD